MESLRYLEDISKGVAAGIGAGRSLTEIQKTLTLDAYKDFKRWDTTREAHIEAVYATIRGSHPTSSGRSLDPPPSAKIKAGLKTRLYLTT